MNQSQSLLNGNGVLEIAELILQHGSSLSIQIDSSHYFEQAYSILCSKTSNQDIKMLQYRGIAYKILALYFTEHSFEKRYIHVMDRLSLLFEGLELYSAHRLPFLELLTALANSYNPDIISHWNVIMNKTIQAWVKAFTAKQSKNGNSDELSENPKREDQLEMEVAEEEPSPTINNSDPLSNRKDFNAFLLESLKILLSSKIRSLLIPHLKVLKTVCIDELFYSNLMDGKKNDIHPLIREFSDNQMSHYFQKLIHTFAYINAIENQDYWHDTFHWIFIELIGVTQQLGLPLKIEIDQSHLKTDDDSSQSHPPTNNTSHQKGDHKMKVIDWSKIFMKKERGIQKALILKNVFAILTMLLQQILLTGSSSGYVRLQLANFFALATKLLPYQKNTNVSDPANFIEKENGLSLVDLQFIISQLKIFLLRPYRTLLRLRHPSYVRLGTTFVQPILSLWLKQNELLLVPELMNEMIETLGILIDVFPVVISRYFNDENYDYLKYIQQLFQQQIQLITEPRRIGNLDDVISSQLASQAINQATSSVKASQQQTASTSTSSQPHKKQKTSHGTTKGKAAEVTKLPTASNPANKQLSYQQLSDFLLLRKQGKQSFCFSEEQEQINDQLTILIFQLIEQLLISKCIRFLSPLFSYQIQQGIFQIFVSITKGIYYPNFPDKRLFYQKHYQATGQLPERIRLSIPLQESFLQLSLTTLLTFHTMNPQTPLHSLLALSGIKVPTGAVSTTASGTNTSTSTSVSSMVAEYQQVQQYHNNYYALNLQYFEQFCHMLIDCNNTSLSYSETLRMTARKALSMISHMLAPMNMVLPVLPPKEMVQYYTEEYRKVYSEDNRQYYREQLLRQGEHVEKASEAELFEASEESMVVEEDQKADSLGEKEELNPDVSTHSEPINPEKVKLGANAPVSLSFPFTKSELAKGGPKKVVQDQESDDDLPDIDISND